MNVLHFADIVGVLRMKSVSENPREGVKCLLEEPRLGVHSIQRFLVLVVKFLPKIKLLFDSSDQRGGRDT